MSTAFATVIEHSQNYFADSLFPLLFALSLIWLIARRKEKDVRSSLLYPNLLLLVIIFCPLTAFVILKVIDNVVYYRLFWMLMLPVTIAYAGTELISSFSRNAVRLIAAVLVLAVIVLGGQSLFTDYYWEESQNYFKLPTEVIYVADAIEEDAAAQGIEYPKAAAPGNLSQYIREYDAGIRLAYGRNMVYGMVEPSRLYDEINSESPRIRRLARLTRKNDCSYLVIPAELNADKKLAKYDFTKVAETAGYAIYFDTEAG